MNSVDLTGQQNDAFQNLSNLKSCIFWPNKGEKVANDFFTNYVHNKVIETCN